jgi:redox-sensitive bicupin YhaK (pirin superfamily)
VAQGTARINGEELSTGDGVAVSDESQLTITGNGEVLVFDLK